MEKIPLFYKFSRFCILVCMKLWLSFERHGEKNVPGQGGCIVVSNHASFLDPLAAGCGMTHRYVRFIARETLFRKRMADWWAEGVGVIRIDRTKGDIAALKAALDVLSRGGLICLFPEGTRTTDGKLQSALGGIGFLMSKANVPVVPAYVDGTFAAFPKGAKWVKPRKVSVTYGAPIQPSELAGFGKGKEAYKKMAALLMERIAVLRSAR